MGIMGEMMNEAVDAAMDNDDLEEETDEEITKVLDEVLGGNKKRVPGMIFVFICRKSTSIANCCS
jgi:hypothetical protein